jgi:GPH family glycoside/pentoside/hexuronide:cation symporter
MPGPLPFRIKFAFGVGQAAEGLKNGAFGTFLLFYYNQVLGMPGTLAGIAVGIALIVDAFTDPLAGSLSDHWHSRHGRRHPFMYASIVPLAVTFYFLFHPMVSSDLGLFVWLVIFTNLSRTSMTLYHVPHIALGAEMTDDFAERSSVVGFRQFFATFGALMATVVGFWIFFVPTADYPNGQLNEAAYAPFALTLSLLMVITIFWSAWGTRAVIPYLPKPAHGETLGVGGVVRRTLEDLASAMRCGSFRWLFGGVLIVYVMVGVDGALNIYIYTYFWELGHNEIVALAPAYPIGVMLGAMLAPRVLGRFGKKFGLIFGTASWASWQILPIVARLLDVFPENGDAWLVPTLIVMRVIQGASTVQANVAFGSMVADTIDEHELATGKRQEGIFFASSSFSAKAASGMGNIIAGFALDLISWPRGREIKTAADVPPEAIFDLGMLYGPYVAGCGFISVWCYTRYRLTRARHEEILRELYLRRGGPRAAA